MSGCASIWGYVSLKLVDKAISFVYVINETYSAACATGAAGKFLGRPALAMAPYWTTSRERVVHELTHLDQPVEIDAGGEPHRLEA